MKKIFIINGAPRSASSLGELNLTISGWDKNYFTQDNYEIKLTDINEVYVAEEEMKKFIWADIIIYHIPVWWFYTPFQVKEYLDYVFEAGHRNGIYRNDGRSRTNHPKLNYGTGGSLHGKKYMLCTTWNAPEEAFLVDGEFFEHKTVDEIFLGFHLMNRFVGLKKIEGIHFFDVQKDITETMIDKYKKEYHNHLKNIF